MARIKMRPIAEPAEGTRSVIKFTGVGPAMKGDATDDLWECGSCTRVLVDGLAVEQLLNLVFFCNVCNGYSETPDITSN